jgi:hypothetical protein
MPGGPGEGAQPQLDTRQGTTPVAVEKKSAAGQMTGGGVGCKAKNGYLVMR